MTRSRSCSFQGIGLGGATLRPLSHQSHVAKICGFRLKRPASFARRLKPRIIALPKRPAKADEVKTSFPAIDAAKPGLSVPAILIADKVSHTPKIRSSQAQISPAASGSGLRSTMTPSALNLCECSGDFSKGMCHPHRSAKQSHEDRADAAVEALSMLIRSSIH